MIQANDRQVNEQKWLERIRLWRVSGQTPRTWCRQNNLAYHNFVYWRQRERDSLKTKSSRFIELPQELRQDPVSLRIEVGGVSLTVDREFDEETLLKVVRLLRRA